MKALLVLVCMVLTAYMTVRVAFVVLKRIEKRQSEERLYRYRDEGERLPLKIRLYIRVLRALGIKYGMASYAQHWYERPLRILFFPIRSLKNKLWWLFRSNV